MRQLVGLHKPLLVPQLPHHRHGAIDLAWGAAAVVKRAWVQSLEEHTDSVRSAQFSPDGLRVVTASDDGTARVWDLVCKRIYHEPIYHAHEEDLK